MAKVKTKAKAKKTTSVAKKPAATKKPVAKKAAAAKKPIAKKKPSTEKKKAAKVLDLKKITLPKIDTKGKSLVDISVEDKLLALYSLQYIDSTIDKIQTIRGELPLEVQDLEDEVTGLDTRMKNFTKEVKALDDGIAEKKNLIKDAKAMIKKYEEQQKNVRNNREFDSLSKEIEYQNLEIQLCEKKINEFKATIEAKSEIIAESKSVLKERKKDLEHKKGELDDIVAETQKEESSLSKKSKKAENVIEERLVTAYKRIRKNVRNGLAVVSVERDACGGCFNKIPPQRQLDIRSHKKIIVCEHCGRILVDDQIVEIVH